MKRVWCLILIKNIFFRLCRDVSQYILIFHALVIHTIASRKPHHGIEKRCK